MNKFQPITGQKTIKSFKIVISLVGKSVGCQNFGFACLYLNSMEGNYSEGKCKPHSINQDFFTLPKGVYFRDPSHQITFAFFGI